MRATSLRLRLAVRFTALMAVLFLLVGLIAVILLRRVLTRQLDDTLLRLASIEASAVTDSPDTTVHFHEGIFNAPRSESAIELVRYAAVLGLDGTPVLRSQSLGANDLPVSASALAAASRGEVVLSSILWDREPLRAIYFPLERVAALHRMHILQVAAPLRSVTTVVVTLAWFLAVIGVVATGMSFVGGWALADRAVRPAREIAERAAAISAGSLPARIEANLDAREYQGLVGVLNDMLGRLEGAFEAQRRFVADASHEIRHPITVLRAALELALRRDRSADEYRVALADGVGQADRVIALAEGLLTLARSDAGVLSPQREAHDLAVVAAEACRRMAPMAAARDVGLGVRATPVVAQVDVALIGRVLDNLIHNALKFTPAGGVVSVIVERDATHVRVDVIDGGPGVAPEQEPHLFERFFRGDDSRAAEGGAGLGLAIAKGIAMAHGGSVSYARAPGAGSRFTLQLPL